MTAATKAALAPVVAAYRAGKRLLPYTNVGRPLRRAGTLHLRFG